MRRLGHKIVSLLLAVAVTAATAPLASLTAHAEGTTVIPVGSYSISSDGVYELADDYSGVITVLSDANIVRIVGEAGVTYTGTSILIAATGRTASLALTIENLAIAAPADSHGIDFASAVDYTDIDWPYAFIDVPDEPPAPPTPTITHCLYISGECAVTGGSEHAGIHIGDGVRLVIDKSSGLTDDQTHLSATGGAKCVGIGSGWDFNTGSLVVVGGRIAATGGTEAAGIGDLVGEIVFHGGVVKAVGGESSSGIGVSKDLMRHSLIEYPQIQERLTNPFFFIQTSTVTINEGAVVTAESGGMHGALGDLMGHVTINGGLVKARGVLDSPGICGYWININGGTVTALGGSSGGAGIGSSWGYPFVGSIAISGGQVVALGSLNSTEFEPSPGSSIPEFMLSIIFDDYFSLTEGEIEQVVISGEGLGDFLIDALIDFVGDLVNMIFSLESINGGAGIGAGGCGGQVGPITITGGTVMAVGGCLAAGIGGGGGLGGSGNAASITISGGVVTATSYYGGAGIGGGVWGRGGDITLAGGTISALGGRGKTDANVFGGGAGIGGGGWPITPNADQGCTITVTGNPSVVATCYDPDKAQDVGSGELGSPAATFLQSASGEPISYVRVEVRSGDLGEPIAGAIVTLDGVEKITNGDGLTGFFISRSESAKEISVSADYYDSAIGTVTPSQLSVRAMVELELTDYIVSIDNGITGGSIAADRATAHKDDLVTLEILPDADMKLKAGTLKYNDGTDHPINGTSFTMPGTNVTVSAQFESVFSEPSSWPDDEKDSAAPAQGYVATVSGLNTVGANIVVSLNAGTGGATIDLGSFAQAILSDGRPAIITVPSIPNATSYTLELPASSLSGAGGAGGLTLVTDIGSITISSGMLAEIEGTEGKKAGITIGQGDTTNLPDDVVASIGDRPVVQLTMMMDGIQTDWNNPNSPVTLSIPYVPTEEEMADPEHIVIWYIDGSGNAVRVPNGRYDATTDTVTFTTSHFSRYAVAYVHQVFGDLESVEWARQSIEVLASKGIINGTGPQIFSPEEYVTRADYAVLMARVLELAAEPSGNFDDVEPGTYYYKAVGTVKETGIASGIGDNRFDPTGPMSRQDMMHMTATALGVCRGIATGGDPAELARFSDAGEIEAYALGSLAGLVKEDLIMGSGDGRLNPRQYATRAEAAVFLYRVYNMIW